MEYLKNMSKKQHTTRTMPLKSRTSETPKIKKSDPDADKGELLLIGEPVAPNMLINH